MARIEKLTKEQEAMIPAVRDEWLRHGLSTEPADFDAAEQAVRDAYTVAGLDPPKIIVRLASPYEGAIGAAILKDTRLGEKVWAQVRDQVGDQVWAQVRDQVWAQVWDQVGDQVWAQVRDQVRDQVWAQVRDQVRDQVGDQVWAQVRDQVNNAFWSQHEAGWLSWLAYFARVTKLPNTEKIEPLLRIAQSCGWVWFFSGVAIITDRPRVLKRDDENRLHCENGPALEYRDGLSVYAWHGLRIPKEWIEDKASLTAKTALTWPNAEQRKAACEILGWNKILLEIGAKVIDEDGDDEIGTLLQGDLPDSPKEKFLQVRCGTGRMFAIPVPPNMKTALEAQAWLWGDTPETFIRPEIRT